MLSMHFACSSLVCERQSKSSDLCSESHLDGAIRISLGHADGQASSGFCKAVILVATFAQITCYVS